jgi:hypothetical protein
MQGCEGLSSVITPRYDSSRSSVAILLPSITTAAMAEEQHFNGDFSSQRHQFIGSHFYGSVTIDSSGRGDEDELTWDCRQLLSILPLSH